MDIQDIVKKMIELHKKSFESFFSMAVMFQTQTENLLRPLLFEAPGMGEKERKILECWIDEYKASQENFKKAIEGGYEKIESFFDYQALLKFQDQNEELLKSFLKQATWLPGDFRKAAEQLYAVYKNSCDQFRKYVEENLPCKEDFMVRDVKSGRGTSRKK